MSRQSLVLSAILLLAPALAHADVVINELLIDPSGTDSPNQYIELRNTAATPVTLASGTYLVAIEGDAGANPGDVQMVIDLANVAIPADGFAVFVQAGHPYAIDPVAAVIPASRFHVDSGGSVEHASATFMLITAPIAPTLDDDIDLNDDCLADGIEIAAWAVLDEIGTLDGGATDCSYAALTFARAGLGRGGAIVDTGALVPAYVGRAGNTTGSTAADWIAGATAGAAPSWVLAASAVPATASGYSPRRRMRRR